MGKPRLAKAAGFSLHCGVAVAAHQRDRLERLCRYIARPAIANERLALTRQGDVRYRLKTPYRDGTTLIVPEPLDFMYRMYGMPRTHGCTGAVIARLAALVPKPRVNLTRFHGVFARNSTLRAQITPARRGRCTGSDAAKMPAQRRAAMTWAQRLKRVFRIDIETCRHCGGTLKVGAPAHPCARDISASVHVIASIEDPAAINRILEHLARRPGHTTLNLQPPARAPPQGRFPGLTD